MNNLEKMKEASISDLKDLESRIEQMTAAEYYNFLSLLEEYDKLTPYFKNTLAAFPCDKCREHFGECPEEFGDTKCLRRFEDYAAR